MGNEFPTTKNVKHCPTTRNRVSVDQLKFVCIAATSPSDWTQRMDRKQPWLDLTIMGSWWYDSPVDWCSQFSQMETASTWWGISLHQNQTDIQRSWFLFWGIGSRGWNGFCRILQMQGFQACRIRGRSMKVLPLCVHWESYHVEHKLAKETFSIKTPFLLSTTCWTKSCANDLLLSNSELLWNWKCSFLLKIWSI